MAWTLSTIRSLVRTLTGEKSTSQWSNADILTAINNFYQNVFPFETRLEELWDWETFSLVDGTETYSVPETVLDLDKPSTIDDGDGDAVDPVAYYRDVTEFRSVYPEDASRAENQPEAVLLYGGVIYCAPIPDTSYTLKFASLEKPTAFAADGDAPVSDRWGRAIAYGTAIQRMYDRGDQEEAGKMSQLYGHLLANISRKTIYRKTGLRGRPRF